MANPLKKLAGQTIIYGLGTILPRFLNYFLTPILTRAFLPAEYGINSELFACISFLNVLFTYGMETTFFNFNAKVQNKQEVFNTAFLLLFGSTLTFTVILLLCAPAIGNALSTPNAGYPTQFIVWCIFIIATDALMCVPFAKLRADNKPLKFSLLKLFNIIVNFFLTVYFVVFCKQAYENNEVGLMTTIYNPEIGIGYCFLAMLIANIFTLLLMSGQIFSVSLNLNIALLKEMLRYTWPLVILGLAGMVNETLDRFVLKKLMVDKAQAQVAQGVYGACYKIAILMTIFIQAFRFAAEPFFFGKEKDSKKTYALVMKYFVIFCLLLFLATQMNLEWIKYFIDEPYWPGLKVVPILLMANLCLGVIYNLSIWYKLSGQTGFGAFISLAGAAITIIINIAFVPTYSYMACAWATLAAYGGMMIISYLLGQKYFPIKYNLRAITVYSLLSLSVYLLSQTYSSITGFTLKIVLNNLLILLFVWIVYKLEFNSLKNLNSDAAN